MKACKPRRRENALGTFRSECTYATASHEFRSYMYVQVKQGAAAHCPTCHPLTDFLAAGSRSPRRAGPESQAVDSFGLSNMRVRSQFAQGSAFQGPSATGASWNTHAEDERQFLLLARATRIAFARDPCCRCEAKVQFRFGRSMVRNECTHAASARRPQDHAALESCLCIM